MTNVRWTFMNPNKSVMDNFDLLVANSLPCFQVKHITHTSHKKSLVPSSPYFVIHPIAGDNINSRKNWPLSYWVDLIKLINEHYPNHLIKVIGSSSDRSFLNGLFDLNIVVEDNVGKIEIEDLPDLLKNAVLYIGLDSGPMHLATFLDIPCLVLWGPTSSCDYGYKSNTNVKYNIFCSPCISPYISKSNMQESSVHCVDYKCINNIDPHSVMRKLIGMLEAE